ncbi:MAG: cytochrome c [Candidatus Binataceae bacterium]
MRTIGIVLGTIVAIVIAAVFFIEVVAPSMNWSAAAEPGAVEEYLADRAIDGWVVRHASSDDNPLPASAGNLKAGRDDYRENCAGCHGLDGSGRNRLGAEFYPPIPKLIEDTQQMTDGQIYFIIAKGIRYSGMPSFENHHKPEQIWRIVLWLRHLPNLTEQEKSEMAAEIAQRGPQPTPGAH